MDAEKPTFGEVAVGLQFNPSNKLSVAVIKTAYAAIIDDLHLTRSESEDPEVRRLCSIAITEAQGAQMWAVKALTWES